MIKIEREPKNFSIYYNRVKINNPYRKLSDEDNSYIQYLCKFKDSVTDEYFDDFLERITLDYELPEEMKNFFREQATSDVINFKDFITMTSKDDVKKGRSYVAAQEFLSMFNFGDKRNKSADQLGEELREAQLGTFGINKKNIRLLKEYRSVGFNNTFINEAVKYRCDIAGIIENNNVGSVKNKNKEETIIKK
jgi:hypothetical protein